MEVRPVIRIPLMSKFNTDKAFLKKMQHCKIFKNSLFKNSLSKIIGTFLEESLIEQAYIFFKNGIKLFYF